MQISHCLMDNTCQRVFVSPTEEAHFPYHYGSLTQSHLDITVYSLQINSCELNNASVQLFVLEAEDGLGYFLGFGCVIDRAARLVGYLFTRGDNGAGPQGVLNAQTFVDWRVSVLL